MADIIKHRGGSLYPFDKGKSGNPNGRPRGTYGLTRRLREILQGDGYMVFEGDELGDDDKPTGRIVKVRARVPKADSILLTMARQAASGNTKAQEMILDRLEGKAKQFVELDFGEDHSVPMLDFDKLSDAALFEISAQMDAAGLILNSDGMVVHRDEISEPDER